MILKDYQRAALERLREYLVTLRAERDRAQKALELGIEHKWDEVAWERVVGKDQYHPRRTGLDEIVPAICLKVPTGGGKTLLAVKAIDLINTHFRNEQTGLVLWIVPSTTIYEQTRSALRDRSHPYRVHLDLASGNRTFILEKQSLFTLEDVRSNLVVLLLMLPSANRQVKETLRIFKDRGGFESFFPREDDYSGHALLHARCKNLDVYSAKVSTGNPIVMTSLGNTLRLLKPVIVLDEGHKAYGELAQNTLLGFNPSFILELSATPTSQSNKLVKISGQELLREGMIKLDVNVYNRASADWRDTMLASHHHRQQLEDTAVDYQQRTHGAYIRPICLIQVERTGEKQQGTHYIHAEDVRKFLIEKCGVPKEQVAVKSSENDEIERTDLLSPDCPIRYIITKYALQEGWDCPFAYILTVLTNPKQASTSITQLVGRVLRQPYARKTDRIELDESYVYCYRESAGELVRAVRAGLEGEGLGDLTGHVMSGSTSSAKVEHQIRAQFSSLTGKIYLPCFVVRDAATRQWREVGYEMDVLSRIDWGKIKLDHFDTLELNPTRTENLSVAVGLGALAEALHPSIAADMPIDPVFITRQISDLVPNPWRAFEYVEEILTRLRRRYSDEQIRRDLAFVIEELKRQIAVQRISLAEQVFKQLISKRTLRFILLSGCLHSSIPETIASSSGAPLTDDMGKLPQFSLFDYRADDFNDVERDVVLYLDDQQWVMGWVRNFVRTGYGIQGWRQGKIYPDFVVFAGKRPEPISEFKTVYVLETKGLHLKANPDTEYKRELFQLCNDLCKPRPWDEVKQEMANHELRYEVVYSDEWQAVVNALSRQA